MQQNLCFKNCKNCKEIGIYKVCDLDHTKPITKMRIYKCKEYEEGK